MTEALLWTHPLKTLAVHAVHQLKTDPAAEGPWAELGVTRRMARRAGEGTSQGDGPELRLLSAVAERLDQMLRSRRAPATAEERLDRLRVLEAFRRHGPAVRPTLGLALRHAGLDLAGTATCAKAAGQRINIPVEGGVATLEVVTRRRADEAAAEAAGRETACGVHPFAIGELRVGVPLSADVRLTTHADGRIMLVVPTLPDAVAAALSGRPASDLFAHPALASAAPRVRAVFRVPDFEDGAPDGDRSVVELDLRETAVAMREAGEGDVAPIARRRPG